MSDLERVRALARRTREIIAERAGWPDGVLEQCVRIELEHPAWSVGWDPYRREYLARHYERERNFQWARGAGEAELVADMAEQDRQAAEQMARWRAWTSPGWSVLRS